VYLNFATINMRLFSHLSPVLFPYITNPFVTIQGRYLPCSNQCTNSTTETHKYEITLSRTSSPLVHIQHGRKNIYFCKYAERRRSVGSSPGASGWADGLQQQLREADPHLVTLTSPLPYQRRGELLPAAAAATGHHQQRERKGNDVEEVR
jgi:hypothetical protein